MEQIIYGVLIGAGGGLCVSLAGYLKQAKTTKEEFNPEQAGITALFGIAAGGLLGSGIVNGDTLLMLLAAMGLTSSGEDAVKAVIRWFSAAPATPTVVPH